MRVLARHRGEQVAGLDLGGAHGDAGHLDAVDGPADLEVELLTEACQGPRVGCSGRRTGGIRALTWPCLLFARGSPRPESVGRLGAPFVCGVMRKVLMTCFMIALKAGAAAAEVLIVSGFAKVTTMAYCGSPAGMSPATDTMRSLP